MKTNITEMVFILDRSGSMNGLEKDTIGGFNSMLEKQKKLDLPANVTTVLFDDKYELLHDRTNIKGISQITEDDYYVRGCTALLDAIGKTIEKIDVSQRHVSDEYKASNVIVIIITDGYENASRKYSISDVKTMIKDKEKNEGWEFIFLGANIDAIAAARDIGIEACRSADFHADARGVEENYSSISNLLTKVRSFCEVPMDWKDSIEEDYNSREKD